MSKKLSLLYRFTKHIVLFGSLFIVLSIVIDWYRKPDIPTTFSTQVFYDLNQQPHIIVQQSANEPMLLYVWGSWCHFCEFTSPAVQQLYQSGVLVLSVALKSGSDNDVSTYLQAKGYQFPTLNDPDGNLSKAWHIQATPTILFIKNGKIINHTTGLTSFWGIKFRLWLAMIGG